MNSIERFLIALGGFSGFAGAFFAALKGGAGVDGALMRASIAMLAAAILIKIFLFITRSTLQKDPPTVAPRQTGVSSSGKPASAGAENR